MLYRILAITLILSFMLPAGTGLEQASVQKETASVTTDTSNSPQPLNPEEAHALSERAEEPGPEVAGGALSNLHLTYIVIALAAAVLVLVLK